MALSLCLAIIRDQRVLTVRSTTTIDNTPIQHKRLGVTHQCSCPKRRFLDPVGPAPHKDYGWTVQIRGVQSGGEVINLPTHTFKTEEGGLDLKCPTETAISDRREAELSKAGLISLVHRSNTDKAAFIGAQSLYKPKKFKSAEATASDNLSSRIPYMFAVSRFAHYLKHMVRDQIGSNREREQLERELQDWVSQYVHASPANASEADKARLRAMDLGDCKKMLLAVHLMAVENI